MRAPGHHPGSRPAGRAGHGGPGRPDVGGAVAQAADLRPARPWTRRSPTRCSRRPGGGRCCSGWRIRSWSARRALGTRCVPRPRRRRREVAQAGSDGCRQSSWRRCGTWMSPILSSGRGQRAQPSRPVPACSLHRMGECFTESAVFAESEGFIPFDLVAWLWQQTAGLAELGGIPSVPPLADLGLITLPATDAGGGGLVVHGVVRHLGVDAEPLTELHEALLKAAAAGLHLPAAQRLGSAGNDRADVAWWELDDAHRYMSDHLIQHSIASGRADDADAVACDSCGGSGCG